VAQQDLGVEASRERVVSTMADEIVEERGPTLEEDDEAYEAAWDEAEREARTRVQAMTDEEVDARDLEDMRETVVAALAVDIVEARGGMDDDGEASFEETWKEAEKEAQARVAQMTDAEVRARWQAVRQELAAELVDVVRGSFFRAMFGWMDLLFVGLAVITAFRLGARGVSVGED
jgi:predicted metal-dependent phosphotriesterase family hydrolase